MDDLYVRFFRVAERRIVDGTGKGVVSFISNFSYLSDPSFVVMRQRFLAEFDTLWVDCMNGDSRETGKLTPDGEPDPSVFSSEHNREGIRVGTAVFVAVRKPTRRDRSIVHFRHFWGIAKREALLASLGTRDFDSGYLVAEPRSENRFSFRPESVSAGFRSWPNLPELAALPPTLGVLDNRREALIRIDRDDVEKRASTYLDSSLSLEEVASVVPELVVDYARFKARAARQRLLRDEPFKPDNIRRLMVRPMDTRWCYYSRVRPLWVETRPVLASQCWPGNRFLVVRNKAAGLVEGAPFFVTQALGMQHAFHKDAYYIPLQLSDNGGSKGALYAPSEPTANLSSSTRTWLSQLGANVPDADEESAALLWMHVLAIGYSPAYLDENADGIRRDWPRIPLPATPELLDASAALGRQLAGLLDPESDVPGVSSGDIRRELRAVGAIASASGKPLDLAGGDLAVTAGWGHAGKGGVTMPGRGRSIERAYGSDERAAIEASAGALGLSAEQAFALLGDRCLDVALNDRAYWRCVPSRVWEYTIGGYQVLKKWLSYRERDILGRDLKPDEARYFTEVARRIAAILLLSPALDENYLRVKDAAFDWRSIRGGKA